MPDDGTLDEARRRLDSFAASLDPALRAREDSIAKQIRTLNASAPTKIRKIYALMDDLSRAAEPFVACKKGCSACCHMNVMITTTEAKLIESATGKRCEPLTEHRDHAPDRFAGTPCPFLEDSVCSIYAHRPFACRKHFSFDTSDYWCNPERMHAKELPLIQFDGAEEALLNVAKVSAGVFADIRDFFPK